MGAGPSFSARLVTCDQPHGSQNIGDDDDDAHKVNRDGHDHVPLSDEIDQPREFVKAGAARADRDRNRDIGPAPSQTSPLVRTRRSGTVS